MNNVLGALVGIWVVVMLAGCGVTPIVPVPASNLPRISAGITAIEHRTENITTNAKAIEAKTTDGEVKARCQTIVADANSIDVETAQIQTGVKSQTDRETALNHQITAQQKQIATLKDDATRKLRDWAGWIGFACLGLAAISGLGLCFGLPQNIGCVGIVGFGVLGGIGIALQAFYWWIAGAILVCVAVIGVVAIIFAIKNKTQIETKIETAIGITTGDTSNVSK